MPSMQQPMGADEKEVLLDRVDDEAFPEADQLIDDFFAEGEELEFTQAAEAPLDEESAVEEPVAEEAAEEAPEEDAGQQDEIVEFDLVRVDEEDAEKEAAAEEEFRSKIEAEIAERLDFGDLEGEEEAAPSVETETLDQEEILEPVIEEVETPEQEEISEPVLMEAEAPEQEETPILDSVAQGVTPDLDAIIDSFASKLAAALSVEIKKRVQEEIEQLRSELSE